MTEISYETHFVRSLSITTEYRFIKLLKLLVEKSDLPEFDKIMLERYLDT